MQYFEKIYRQPTAMSVNLAPIKEIDEVLRAACQIDDKKRGMCGACPYREFFYGEEICNNSFPASALPTF